MTISKLPTNNKPVENFIDTIRNFYHLARGTNRSEIQKWLDDDCRLVKRGYAALKKEQMISTIINPRATQKLNTFFYTPRISYIGEKKEESSILELFNDSSNLSTLILGRLGQGKSMLLRYLEFVALNTGNSIPIFLELRKINSALDIETECWNKLNRLGFECSRKLFDFLSTSGKLSFFLDGFDEIAFEKRPLFFDQISKILSKVPSNNIYITSRYNTEIEQLSGLKIFEILPLNSEDHPKFISKLLKDEEKSREIIKKIGEAKAFDPSVLDTPLMLTWFIMVYEVRRKIPKTKIGFYEELFKTILSRHDGLKLSFDRPSRSGLSDSEIELVLHAFCYLSSRDNIRDFEYKKIIEYIQMAINITKIPKIKADDYLYDLTNITCLIVKDGLTYQFIHGTIQSYFSACFIKETNESNSKKFYTKADLERNNWIDELGFLMHLDSYRFYKFMVIPTISSLSGLSQAKMFKGETIESLSDNAIKDIYSESVLIFKVKDGIATEYISTIYIASHSFSCHLTFNDANFSLCETDRQLERYINSVFKRNKNIEKHAMLKAKQESQHGRNHIGLIEFIEKNSLLQDFCNKIEAFTLNKLNLVINTGMEIIKAEDSKGGLF